MSFTFILFGLTVVASSINLLVLKFLTMNTDDERREEYSRKAQKTQNFQFSTSDLDAQIGPSELEDLKRENSFRFCFPNNRFSIFQNRFPYVFCKRGSIPGSLTKESYNDETNSYMNQNFNINTINTNTTQGFDLTSNTNTNDDGSNLSKAKSVSKPIHLDQIPVCSLHGNKKINLSCLNVYKNKKTHYTIRRGPGKISHLLIPNRANSLTIAKPKTDSPRIVFTNKRETSDKIVCNNKANGTMFEVNTFIDDDNEIEEFLPIDGLLKSKIGKQNCKEVNKEEYIFIRNQSLPIELSQKERDLISDMNNSNKNEAIIV